MFSNILGDKTVMRKRLRRKPFQQGREGRREERQCISIGE
jgi:hypothetical protein